MASELSRLASGVICAGFPGAGPDPAVLEELAELAPAGVVLFARNAGTPLETRALVEAVRGASGPATFVTLDQEGGRVARLRAGFSPLPSLMALGACAEPALAEQMGSVLAADLAFIGADVDFAPVLDLALEPANTVIGTRAFGDDPALVARLGAALVRGLQNGGIAATLKHFPGHGATAGDSHRELPRVEVSEATLRAREFVPFRACIAAGARAVMSAHVVVPALDADSPATLSPRILNEILRHELGFGGVCFSDALEMEAIAAAGGTAQGAVRAIAAGADCVVIGIGLEAARAARAALVEAVRSGALPEERLREAARRTAALAPVRRGADAVAGGLAGADDDPGVRDGWKPSDAGLAMARRSITVVRGDVRLDPAQPLSLISFEGARFDGAGGTRAEFSLNLALRRRHVRSELLRVPLDPDDETIAHLLELVRTQQHRVALVMRRAHLFAGQRAAVDALLAVSPGAIAISALEPFDVPVARSAAAVVCTYGDEELALDALADVMTGRAEAAGRLPVTLAYAAS